MSDDFSVPEDQDTVILIDPDNPMPGDVLRVGPPETIEVYVRLAKGENGSDSGVREVSFTIPDDEAEITQDELLEEDFAIDGNRAVRLVIAYNQHDYHVPLMDALRDLQRWLVKWFYEKGYNVVFK